MKGQLFLYHVSIPDSIHYLGYDSYSEFVIASTCEENARHVHPGSGLGKGKWNLRGALMRYNDWIHEEDIDKLIVKCIGVAQPGLFQEDEIIISSYHAG